MNRTAKLGWALLAVVAVSILAPGTAPGSEPISLVYPEEGMVVVTVIMEGEKRTVLWPKGASLTPRWVVAALKVETRCPKEAPGKLQIRIDQGPNAGERSEALPSKTWNTTTLETYLWELEAVRTACTREGDVRLESLPVFLSLSCSGESRAVPSVKKTVDLTVRCRPAGRRGPQGAPLEDEDPLHDWSFATMDVRASRESLVLYRKVPVLFSSGWSLDMIHPTPSEIRLVRLDAAGSVAEVLGQCKAEEPAKKKRPPCQVQREVMAVSNEPLRMCLVAEYLDGTSLQSKPVSLVVHSERDVQEQQQKRELARKLRPGILEAVTKKKKEWGPEKACGPQMVEWLKAQPGIADAGTSPTGLWFRFIDGRTAMFLCGTGDQGSPEE